MERSAKSLADDLGMDRGVVHSRAASSLRSAETNPFDPRDLSAFSGRTNSRHIWARASEFVLGRAALPSGILSLVGVEG